MEDALLNQEAKKLARLSVEALRRLRGDADPSLSEADAVAVDTIALAALAEGAVPLGKGAQAELARTVAAALRDARAGIAPPAVEALPRDTAALFVEAWRPSGAQDLIARLVREGAIPSGMFVGRHEEQTAKGDRTDGSFQFLWRRGPEGVPAQVWPAEISPGVSKIR